jgi:hypothetical protein
MAFAMLFANSSLNPGTSSMSERMAFPETAELHHAGGAERCRAT